MFHHQNNSEEKKQKFIKLNTLSCKNRICSQCIFVIGQGERRKPGAEVLATCHGVGTAQGHLGHTQLGVDIPGMRCDGQGMLGGG